MIERVKSLHWLAIYQIQRGVKVTGQRLPSYDNEQILAAAQGHAFAARRDYYLTLRGPYHPKPTWIREDYLLDEESEKKVIEDASFRNRQIIGELEDQRWRVEQKTSLHPRSWTSNNVTAAADAVRRRESASASFIPGSSTHRRSHLLFEANNQQISGGRLRSLMAR